MNRQEARDLGRRLYAQNGISTYVDTLVVRPDGRLEYGGQANPNGWALFMTGVTGRIVAPQEHCGRDATPAADAADLTTLTVCWGCVEEVATRGAVLHEECQCVVHCGNQGCCGARYAEQELV